MPPRTVKLRHTPPDTDRHFARLCEILNREYRRRSTGNPRYTVYQWAMDIDGDISGETLQRLMDPYARHSTLSLRTLIALVNEFGQEATDALGITPQF